MANMLYILSGKKHFLLEYSVLEATERCCICEERMVCRHQKFVNFTVTNAFIKLHKIVKYYKIT